MTIKFIPITTKHRDYSKVKTEITNLLFNLWYYGNVSEVSIYRNKNNQICIKVD